MGRDTRREAGNSVKQTVERLVAVIMIVLCLVVAVAALTPSTGTRLRPVPDAQEAAMAHALQKIEVGVFLEFPNDPNFQHSPETLFEIVKGSLAESVLSRITPGASLTVHINTDHSAWFPEMDAEEDSLVLAVLHDGERSQIWEQRTMSRARSRPLDPENMNLPAWVESTSFSVVIDDTGSMTIAPSPHPETQPPAADGG